MEVEEIKQILRTLGIRPQKNRGQNFLHSSFLAEEIISFANLDFNKPILEIGPGLGILSEALHERAKGGLTFVELEGAFADRLKKLCPEARVIESDIRKIKLEDFFSEPVQIISNLPYSISSDVIFWILDQKEMIDSASLLLQQEFARRVGATPGNKSYGILSVQTQVYCETELGLSISGDSFYPSAEVESQVIKLIPLAEPRYKIADYQVFRDLVRTAFATRRKTLGNNLKKLNVDFDALGIDPKRRAETLSVEEFVRLGNSIV